MDLKHQQKRFGIIKILSGKLWKVVVDLEDIHCCLLGVSADYLWCLYHTVCISRVILYWVAYTVT